ncbi:hypothetical protein JCM10450v2_007151 [Rhodotorula kratochvilovae]
MSAGSDLMNCLGTWASMPPIPSATGAGVGQSAQSLCDHTQMANCWAEGLYCREWLPIRTAADKFCALATAASSPSSSAIPSETFSSVSAEASEVVTSIWNNDSGTDIPSITNDLDSTFTRPAWTHAGSDASIPTQTGTAATAGASGEASAAASGSVGAAQGGGSSGAVGRGAAVAMVLAAAGGAAAVLA